MILSNLNYEDPEAGRPATLRLQQTQVLGDVMKHARLLFVCFCCSLAILLCATSSSAQQVDNGQISGTVTDPSGSAIPNVKVLIVQEGTGAERSANTDTSGNYIFLAVTPARYTLTIEATGFAKAVANGVEVLVGQTTVQNVQLALSSATSEVTVTGAAPLVQTSTAEVGGVVDREEIAALPLKNRDFTDLATLVPQIVRTPPIDPTKTLVGEISVAGTGGRQSNVFVDGFENFDVVVGGLGYDVSPEAIQEFNVLTNNFSAEQARSVGAVVNIVERSGSNQFHGSAFYFFRNQDLTARDYFQASKSSYRRDQQGISLGGPLKRDKLFGFLAWEDHREQDVGVVNTFGVYPQFQGNFPLPLRRDFVTAKLDWAQSEKNHIFYRFNLDNFDASQNVGGIRAESNGESNLTNTQAHGASDTYVISPNKVNTFGFQFYRYANALEPFSHDPEMKRPDLITGQRTGDPQATIERRYEIKDDFSITKGAHSFRFGGEYHHVYGDATFSFAPEGSFTFFEDAPLNAQFADLLIQAGCSTPNCNLGSGTSSIVGVYAQDDWKIRKNLTVNLGLRWDYFSNANDTDFTGGLGLLAPPGSRTSDKKDFAPRIGFAYDPFGKGKFVVRAGYGIYFENVNFLDTLLERGFDGRNIGYRVTFDPGGVNIAHPYGNLTPQQIHDMFFGPPVNPLAELDNHLRTPYLQYWTGGYEWSFAPKWVLAMTGVHSLGIRGLISRNINVDQNFVTAAPDAPLCQMFSNTTCNDFGVVPWIANGDHLHYNAFVIAVTKNMSHRFLLNASYTLSKAEDETDDPTGSGPLTSNPFNYRQDYGPAQTDQRNRFIFSGVFDPSHLPPFFGKGWQLSLITSFTTPLPYDITESSPAADGSTPIRPPGITRNNGARGSASHVLAEINAFRATEGLAPLTRPLNPLSLNIRSTDFRVSKTLFFGDRVSLDLRAESFNIFNSANFVSNSGNAGAAAFGFSGVNGTADSNNIGLPSSTLGVLADGGPRSFQFSVKFNW